MCYLRNTNLSEEHQQNQLGGVAAAQVFIQCIAQQPLHVSFAFLAQNSYQILAWQFCIISLLILQGYAGGII